MIENSIYRGHACEPPGGGRFASITKALGRLFCTYMIAPLSLSRSGQAAGVRPVDELPEIRNCPPIACERRLSNAGTWPMRPEKNVRTETASALFRIRPDEVEPSPPLHYEAGLSILIIIP